MKKENTEKLSVVNRLLAAHNEVVFNIYGEGEKRKLDSYKTEREEIIVRLTDNFVKDAPEEKLSFIIATVLQQDVLHVKRTIEIIGEVVLDEKGLYITKDREGIYSFRREYLPRDKYKGALTSRLKEVKEKQESQTPKIITP